MTRRMQRLWALALLVAIILPVPGAARAQTARIVDLCQTDVQAGKGTNLRTALLAGGAIRFDCGGAANIFISTTHVITRDVELFGDGRITLRLEGSPPVFQTGSASARLSLVGVNVREAGPSGGLIVNNAGATVNIASARIEGVRDAVLTTGGAVRITDVTFVDSKGAVVNNGGTVVIRDSKFEGSGDDRLFAILNRSGDMLIDDSDFRRMGKASRLISAVFNTASLVIRNSRFDGNTSTSGLIGSPSGSLTVEVSAFSGNSAQDTPQSTGRGGAISSAGSLVVRGSQFVGNTATGCGGAIYVLRKDGERVEVRNSTFEDNSAACGGAVALEPASSLPPPAAIAHSTFKKNSATGSGGAVGIGVEAEGAARNGVVSMRSVIFSENTAGALGGALAAQNASIEVSAGIFVRNRAAQGGAVALVSAVTTPSFLANSLVARNAAALGGGILSVAESATLSLVNSTLAENTPGGVGSLSPAGTPGAGEVRLANSILLANEGWNCQGERLIDDGHNLQFPGTTCGQGIREIHAVLDGTYAPLGVSPALNAGDDAVCARLPIGGVDVYGQRRPRFAHCSIGAVEGQRPPPVKPR